jgi:predicted TIM-barrel fold metal-dependent hydrolase
MEYITVYTSANAFLKQDRMVIVDTHAHAFTLAGTLVAGRRYTPEREAPLAAYASELDRWKISHAVLVQPSFLGTDNRYLIECLKYFPGRLRGIAVVDPSWDRNALAHLAADGIVGIRLNLLGMDSAFVATDDWQRLFQRVAELDWQVEVHIEGARLPFLLDSLWRCGVNIVVDHFGRPDPALGLQDPGVKAMLQKADAGRIWVKLSGPYRCEGNTELYARTYIDALGAPHLLWGSDWPWTQHSEGMSYGKAFGWIERWAPEAEARSTILGRSALHLFKFQPDQRAAGVRTGDRRDR